MLKRGYYSWINRIQKFIVLPLASPSKSGLRVFFIYFGWFFFLFWGWRGAGGGCVLLNLLEIYFNKLSLALISLNIIICRLDSHSFDMHMVALVTRVTLRAGLSFMHGI